MLAAAVPPAAVTEYRHLGGPEQDVHLGRERPHVHVVDANHAVGGGECGAHLVHVDPLGRACTSTRIARKSK